MTIVDRERALVEYDKRTKCHARPLMKLWRPMLDFIENVADVDENGKKFIAYHKRTCQFRVNNKWRVARGVDGYKELEIVDWNTKGVITKFSGYCGG